MTESIGLVPSRYLLVFEARVDWSEARPREIRKKWHMLEKFDILIFRPEIPYCESINVVYFLGEKLFVFSRKFSKTATAVKCPKLMPRVRIQKLCSSISQKEVGFFEIYILV